MLNILLAWEKTHKLIVRHTLFDDLERLVDRFVEALIKHVEVHIHHILLHLRLTKYCQKLRNRLNGASSISASTG